MLSRLVSFWLLQPQQRLSILSFLVHAPLSKLGEIGKQSVFGRLHSRIECVGMHFQSIDFCRVLVGAFQGLVQCTTHGLTELQDGAVVVGFVICIFVDNKCLRYGTVQERRPVGCEMVDTDFCETVDML